MSEEPSGYVALRLRPVSFTEARRFVAEKHRHNDPPIAARVSVGIEDAIGKLRGVGILGLPKARYLDDGRTAEIVRVATDGVRNGCSMIYGALVRAAWSLGYDRIYTYTLESETGSSLRASGWTLDQITEPANAKAWNSTNETVRSRDRLTLFYEAKVPVGRKIRWVISRRKEGT